MQVLWHEALEGDCLITMDEFLYCYKPSKIKKSTGFYQFSFRGPHCSLIKGHSSSNRLWKTEFFIISRNWVGDPIGVSNAPFSPFTSPLGRLRPEGMSSFHFFFFNFLTLFLLLMQLLLIHIWTNFTWIILTKSTPPLGDPSTT